MKWLALLGKELQQHGAAVLGALVLLASVQVVTWGVSFFENKLTLMNTVFELAVFPLPVFVLFLAGRLVVHDHARGTHEFLVALPIAPAHRVLARFGLGMAVVQGAGLISLGTTALLATRREGLPLSWLLQLFAQETLHLWGWFGMAFGMAHLGRFRWLAWWTLFVAGISYSTHFPDGPDVSWFGMMSGSVDVTRLDPPWGSALPAFLWGVAGLVVALLLSGWRGGILLERWFQPITAYQRATLLGAGVAIMFGADALDPLAPEGQDTWAELPSAPAERAQVRVAGSAEGPLWSVGEKVATELDALGAAVGVERWRPVVLVRDRRAPGRPTVRPTPDDDGEQAVVLRVDLDTPQDDLVRRILRETLLHHMGGLAAWDDEARFVLDGAGAWWVGGDDLALQALASRYEGEVDGLMSDWLAAGLGPDEAPALAWAGLVSLEEAAGREAVLQLLREVLAHDGDTPIDGLALRRLTADGWVERSTGAPPSWKEGWARVAALAHGAEELSVAVEVDDGQVVARWARELPAGAVVEWATLDPSLLRPLLDLETEVVVVEPGQRELALPGDAEARVVARILSREGDVLHAGPWAGPP